MHRREKKELVLITGGAGFIGSHLVDALIRDGYPVRVLDNLSPPTHDGRLPSWFNKKAAFMKGDVRNKNDWARALRGVSCVFHLAAYMDYHLDFSKYIQTNTESAALLYELIIEKKLPIKKIILASSQSVYGEGKYRCATHGVVYAAPRSAERLKKGDWRQYCFCGLRFTKILPQKETDALFPGNAYGISKRALEELALTLGRQYSIPTVVLRYSIVHGPRQSWRHFYSGALRSFAVQALAGEPIEMHEDAGQMRDFIHIDDVVRAHLIVLKNRKANYEIFNVGSGRKETVMKLARTVAAVAGVPFRPVLHGIYRAGSMRHSVMDVSKLRRIGWKPQRKLIDNVRDYILWVKEYPQAIHHLHNTYRDLKKRKIVR